MVFDKNKEKIMLTEDNIEEFSIENKYLNVHFNAKKYQIGREN